MDYFEAVSTPNYKTKDFYHTATIDAVLFLKDLLQSDSDEEILNKINELRK